MTEKINKIISELNKRGYKAEKITVVKNGIEKIGVIIGDGSVRPTVYPNLDSSIEECLKEIVNAYKNTPKFDVNEITSWEYAKDRLQLCLQRKTNEDILKRGYLDMEMYIRVKLSETKTYKVKTGMFDNVSEDEIFARALLNTKDNIVVENMMNIIANAMEYIGELPIIETENEMIVVTSKEKLYGAIGISYKDLLSKIARKYDSSLVILPSSIHECIIQFDNNPDMKSYEKMVQDVNETQVEPEEVLSDHAYFFNKETGEITW